MNYNNSGFGKLWLATAALLTLTAPLVQASAAPTVSGTYQVLRNRILGSQSQIQMRVRLINHGGSNVVIQRITLSDFSRTDKGATTACSVALRAHSSAETTVEFYIRRSDYTLWQKGFRPRLVLHMAGPSGTSGNAVVRLERASAQEAK